jgi:alanine-synthesizing transaminase
VPVILTPNQATALADSMVNPADEPGQPPADPPQQIEPISQGRPFSIEVSERVRRLPPYLFAQLNRMKAEKRRAGDDVIDLGMGNPSDPPQDLVIEKLAEAARDPKNHGYCEAAGILSLRREVAAKYVRQHGVRLDPQRETIVTLGSKEGFSHLCLALLGPGDTAIVPAPSYPAHLYAVALASANAILLDVMDPQKLLENVDSICRHMVPKPKLWVINYPHNPTSTVIEPGFFVEAVRLAKRYGMMIISDLAYADVTFDGYKTPSILATPGGMDLAVEMTTMSKGYNMAGWRVGYCCGNAEIVRALATIKTYYDYGMFRPIQIAAILALRHTEAAVEAQAAIYQHRRDVLCDGLERLGWPIERPKATMFVWAKIPEPWASQMNSFDFSTKLLSECDVAVSPGGGFGPAGEGYLRMALVENENRLRQAVRQIGRSLAR